MNFIIDERCHAQSRLAKVKWSSKPFQEVCDKTPLCLMYTLSGSVPHLSKDVLQKALLNGKHATVLPLPSTYCFSEALSQFNQGIGKFVAIEDSPLYISNQDPAVLTPTGYNVKAAMSIWNNAGKSRIDVNDFISFLEVCKPQCYQALSDGDTPRNCSKKRVSNSVRYSLELLDACLERHSKSQVLKGISIFGSIQGAYDTKARQFSAKHTAERAVDGFVLEGFHCNGPEAEKMHFTEVKELINQVIEILPEGKPRIMHGAFSPLFILEAVEAGVDIFDASLPYIVTERGSALVFPLDKDHEERRLDICLTDKMYREDFSPLLQDCHCYTCQNFTKAYVNHLLLTSEMLAPVLLMIHNLHHFFEFFKRIQNALKFNELGSLKDLLKCLKGD